MRRRRRGDSTILLGIFLILAGFTLILLCCGFSIWAVIGGGLCCAGTAFCLLC